MGSEHRAKRTEMCEQETHVARVHRRGTTLSGCNANSSDARGSSRPHRYVPTSVQPMAWVKNVSLRAFPTAITRRDCAHAFVLALEAFTAAAARRKRVSSTEEAMCRKALRRSNSQV